METTNYLTQSDSKINNPIIIPFNQSNKIKQKPSIHDPKMILEKVNSIYIETINKILPHKFECQYQKLKTDNSSNDLTKLIIPNKPDYFPPVYLFSCPELLDIHSNPLLFGKEILKKNQTSTQSLLETLYSQSEFSWFKSAINKHELHEFCLLYGGLGYKTKEAYQNAFNNDLPRYELNIKRTEEKDGWGYKIIDSDTNLTNIPSGKNLKIIITDTAATLTSFVQGTEIFFQTVAKQNSHISNLLFYSIGSSSFAAFKLKKYEKYIQQKYDWPNFQIDYVAANALFALHSNGTDLVYRHNNIYFPPDGSFFKLLRNKPYIALNKCCVYDWGDHVSLNKTRKLQYFINLKKHFINLPKLQDESSAKYIQQIITYCQNYIANNLQ